MFVRVTKTVQDKGKLVRPDKVLETVNDPDYDWYYSPFVYGDDALEYFEEHGGIKGYTGHVFTNVLYWDLDCESDFEKSRQEAVKLVNYLEDHGYGEGIQVFFSGNKGFHVLLFTDNEFNPQQTKKICYNVAIKAGVSQEVFDTSVYNVNRIFRIPGTKHQKSNLYKISLEPIELEKLSGEQIRDLAKTPREDTYEPKDVDAQDLLDQYGTVIEPQTPTNNVIDMNAIRQVYGEDFNPMDCPPDKRRCIYVLENGYFGPGQRENATIRLVAYHHAQGKTREQTRQVILDALTKRSTVYRDLNPWNESDIDRVLDEVYSPNWNGGMYSCRTDEFLKSKCDLGTGCCADEKKQTERVNAVRIGSLIEQYIEYGNEALQEYPKTGIEWIDSNVRFRPKNFSIINGANGSGKTSLAIQMMENLNQQKIWHIFFSLDMANTSLLEKLGAKYTNYNQDQIEKAFNVHTRNEKIMMEVAKELKERLPYTLFDFTSSVDSEYIEHTISTLKTRELDPINIQVGFIDYAGRVTADDAESEFSSATKIALKANDIAKRTNTHLVYISQIPREQGDHTMPIRSSRVAKNSGAWEENATIVVNCWRPFGNGIKRLDKFMHVYIAKNRSGELGEHVFGWDGKTGTIYDIDEKQFKEYRLLCEREGKEAPYNQFDENEEPEYDDRVAKSGMFELDKEQQDEIEDEDYEPDDKTPSSSKFARSKKASKTAKK